MSSVELELRFAFSVRFKGSGTGKPVLGVADQTWTEKDRLPALRSYGVLDTPPEPAFDHLVRLAAQVCRTPVAPITLVDSQRQWFKAEIGLGLRETPLYRSICATAMLQQNVLIVPDTTQDPRFRDNPLVTGEPRLRFYAGARLQTPSKLPLGALCVLDRVSRSFSDNQVFALTTGGGGRLPAE